MNTQTTQTKQARHTPLPWDYLVGPAVTVGIYGQGTICECGEQPRLGGLHLDRDTAIANAQLIVRAVNSHEELLGALQLCLERLDHYTHNIESADLPERDEDALVLARAALAHATGE